MTYYNSSYDITPEQYDSDYDSTWDDYKAEESKGRRKKTNKDTPRKRAARDSQRYRHGYMDNLSFYQNKKRFDPDGEYIDYIHQEWRTDYDLLEYNHYFIQWLFPIQEQGVNRQATPLTPKEREEMKEDSEVMERLMKSYKLMLGFYGIELMNEKTGEVTRARNWKERFRNLNSHAHNNLRITRILKCLGEFGYEHFQAPLVRFFLEETLCEGELSEVKKSALDYFMFTVKNKEERRKLVRFAWENYKPQADFIWGPVEILKELDPTITRSGHLLCDKCQASEAHDENDFGNSSSEEITVELMQPEQDSPTGGVVVDPKKSGSLISYVFSYISHPFKMLLKLLQLNYFFNLILSPFHIIYKAYRSHRATDNAGKKEQSSEETLDPNVIERFEQSVTIYKVPAQSKNGSHGVVGHKGTSIITDISRNIQSIEPEWSHKVNKTSEDGNSDNTSKVSRSSQEEQDQQQEQTIKFETEELSSPQTHKKDAWDEAVLPSGDIQVEAEESISETGRHGVGQVQHSGLFMDSDTVAHYAFEQNTLAAQGDQKLFKGTEKSNITKESKEREYQDSQFTGNNGADDQNTRSGGIPARIDPERQQDPSGEQITKEKSNDGKADHKVEYFSIEENALKKDKDLGSPEEDAAKQPGNQEGKKKGEMIEDGIKSQIRDDGAPDDGGNREDSSTVLGNRELPLRKAEVSQNAEDGEAWPGVHIGGGGTDDDNSRDCGNEEGGREDSGAANTEIPVGKADLTQNVEDREDGEAWPVAHIGGGGTDDDNSRDSGSEEGCSSEGRTGIEEEHEVDVRASSGAEETT